MFDLDAYLRRIGCEPMRGPTSKTLAAVCAAHSAAITFENLDALFGRVPSLDPSALQAKLVGQRRGGYCYEQNALLRLALLAFGMQVTSLAARVVWMSLPHAPMRARSHMLLKVELPSMPDESYLVDVGFGGHIVAVPLRFVPGLVQHTTGGTERISQDGDVFAVEAELPQGWSPLYRFTLEPQSPVDYEPLNWFTATHPSSIFRHNLRLERLTPDLRASLFNDRLTLRRAGTGAEVRRVGSPGELADVVDAIFDLEPPVGTAELWNRIPKGLDEPWFPPQG